MKKSSLVLLSVLAMVLFSACGGDKNPTKNIEEVEAVHIYGTGGSHPVAYHDEVDGNKTTVYFPTDIPDGKKVPVIFFDSGYSSLDSKDYESLLRFMASHGYYVIYAKQDWLKVLANYEKMLNDENDILPHLDTTRIGVVGHSLGAGKTFKILDYFSKKGYGDNGRFIMALEAWYAFGMNRNDMKNLPSNTNVVMQQYGVGGNNANNDTDPRIPLTEYNLLESIDKDKKDWQIIEDANHRYPYGSGDYSTMQGILKPLDALMEYTFNGRASAHDIALEQGNDDPYAKGNGIQVVNPSAEYGYKCYDNEVVEIDYCTMNQKQLILAQKGAWLPQMAGNYIARVDYIKTLPFSGFTMVGNSYTNEVMNNNITVTYDDVWKEVKGVKDLYPNKSNFLMIHMHFPGDFWDDGRWNKVIANFGTLAKIAKDLGFAGIIYDNEAYDNDSHFMINYDKGEGGWYDVNTSYANPNYTFKEHVSKVTNRFKQIMEAMVSEYPDIDVLNYRTPAEGHIVGDRGIDGHPVTTDAALVRAHELTGAMFVGLKQGLSKRASLHDMGENYRLRTEKHFEDTYEWRKHTIATNETNDNVDDEKHWIVPMEERKTWAHDTHVDFMVSNEPLSSNTYPEFDTTDKVSLQDMRTTLERSIEHSDEYVVFYSASSSDDKKGKVQIDWLNDPSTLNKEGIHYGLDQTWLDMMKEVYNSKIK